MNTLTSQCTKIHFTALVGNHVTDITEDIYVIKLDDIAPAVNLRSRETLSGFSKLEEAVLQNMYHPVVLVENTWENYSNAIETVHKGMQEGYYPKRRYLCLFGNQRLAIASRNGYDSISAVCLKDVNRAIVIGKYNEGIR